MFQVEHWHYHHYLLWDLHKSFLPSAQFQYSHWSYLFGSIIRLWFRFLHVDSASWLLFSCPQVMWVCNLCRKQQEILTKSGAWFYSGGPEANLASGASDPHRRHEEAPQEKKAKLQEAPLLYQGPPGERTRGPGLPRQASLNNDTLTNRWVATLFFG